MSNDTRKDLPPSNSANFLEKVREAVQTYIGTRGDKLDRGLTVRDLVDAGLVKINPRYLAAAGRVSPLGGVGQAVLDAYAPDLTPAPTPTGFTVSAAISNLFLEHSAPAYTQGHGHAKTVVYGATWISGPLPVFANAVQITEFSGTVFAHPTNPATTWHLWIKWVTVDGVESTVPAGGTNGLIATTGQDVALLLKALSGEITASQLHGDLGSRINLIDSPAVIAGSVNARLAAEALARSQAISAESDLRVANVAALGQSISDTAAASVLAVGNEVTARNSAIAGEAYSRVQSISVEQDARVISVTSEARQRLAQAVVSAEAMLHGVLATNAARLDADTTVVIAKQELTENFEAGIFAEATQRLTLAAKLEAEKSSTLALISSESTARATAVGAEATQRNLLATQFRGNYTGTDPAQLTEGLLFQERAVRVAQGNSLAHQMTLLSAGVGEQFDWDSIWYFDATVEGWTGNGTPTAAGGFLRPADAADPYVISPDSLALDGDKYMQMRLRVRKYGSPIWAGQLRWATPALNTFNETNVIALTEPTYDANGIGLITVNAGWAGTINRVRLDLSTNQTGSDYFTIDWVAVGRPSPGASSAQLLEEQPARVNADVALTSSVTTLSAQVNNAINGLPAAHALIVAEQTARATADTAEAAARTTLAARVTTTEGAIVTNASAITTESVTRANADSTNSAAITMLSSQVNDGTTGLAKTRSDLQSAQATFSDATRSFATDAQMLRSQSRELSETTLTAILNGEAAKTDFAGSLALAREELHTEIVDGVSAEASKRLMLAAVVGAQAAALTSEQSTRASQDEAIAATVTTLTAVVSGVSAAVTNESNARATADTANANSINALSVQVNNSTTGLPAAHAGVVAEASARATAITAEAAARTTLAARVTGTEDGLTAATSAITTEAITRSTQTTALSDQLEVLTSTVGNNQSTLVNDYFTKSDTNSATAAAQQTLIANFGPNSIFRANTAPVQSNTPITLANGAIIQKPAIKSGDLWFDTDDGAKPHQWDGGAWVYSPDVSAAANTAYLDSLETALANATSATVTAWRNLVAEAKDPVTGLAATRSDLQIEQETRAMATESSAKDAHTLRSQSRAVSDVLLQSILNGEAAKDAFTGSLALAREEITTHIVDGISAEAAKRLTLAAAVNTNAAALTQEQTTRANQIEAVAQDISRLNSTVGDNQAALVNDYYTKANTDGSIAQAGTYLRAYADLGVKTFTQATAPTKRGVNTSVMPNVDVPLVVGDLWADTDDKKQYRWNGASWVAFSDTADFDAWVAGSYADDKAGLEDAKIESWFSTTDPSLIWDGTAASHTGDFWYSAAVKLLKHWSGTSWATIENQAAIDAAQAASDAQEAADGKIVTFAQSNQPDATAIGDLWIDTDDKNKLYRWNGGAWATLRDGTIADADARISSVESTQIGYCLLGGGASDHTTRGACEAAGGTWNVGLPIATAIKQVSISDGATSATLEQRATAQKTTNGELYAQYTVKLDINGKVSGFGLASTGPMGPGSTFEVRVNKFVIAAEAGAEAGFVPFAVLTEATNIDGVAMPAGAYASKAFILDLQVTNAKIANLAVDDAKIANLSVSKLTAGAVAVGQYIQSTGYVAGSAGWRINGNGSAEFSGVVVRGTVYASAGQIGGNTIDSTGMQSPGYVAGSTGWRLDSDGSFHAKNGTFQGSITGATGTFSGDLTGASINGATGTFSGSLNVVNSTSTGRVEIKDNVIKVFSIKNGVETLRVHIGDLSL